MSTNKGYENLSKSNAHATSLSIGHRLNVFDTGFRFEPSLGYTFYKNDIYSLNMYFVEVPILYKFNLYNQNISIGTSIKTYYISNLEINEETYNSGTTFDGAYSIKMIFERKSYDYFIFYEHIIDEVNFYKTDYSTLTITSGSVDMNVNYIGAGARLKF